MDEEVMDNGKLEDYSWIEDSDDFDEEFETDYEDEYPDEEEE